MYHVNWQLREFNTESNKRAMQMEDERRNKSKLAVKDSGWVSSKDMQWKPVSARENKPEVSPEAMQTRRSKNRAMLKDAIENNYLMGWFRVLIYAVLFIAAAFCFFNAFIIITGRHYPAEVTAFPQEMIKLLTNLDVLFACVFILLGAGMIIARFRLASFKRGAPMFLFAVTLLMVVFIVVSTVTYNTCAGECLSEHAAITPSLGGMPAIALLAGINLAYFKKRKALFVH